MDSSLNPISFNAEAMQILSYPNKFASSGSSIFPAGKIRSILVDQRFSDGLLSVTEYRSGRRRYFCRIFHVDLNAKDPSRASIAVLLERGPSNLIPLDQISQRFNLTQREREALEHLMQGLSSKEIADRMNISPNTAKAFLRFIMIKTGVTCRTAIPWKIMMSKPN